MFKQIHARGHLCCSYILYKVVEIYYLSVERMFLVGFYTLYQVKEVFPLPLFLLEVWP